MSTAAMSLALGTCALITSGQASAAGVRPALPSISNIKDEHVRPVPGHRIGTSTIQQEPSVPPSTSPARTSRTAAATAANASQGFLTRPYTTWHNITSVFDHCNPDYTADNQVCRFDGTRGFKAYGVDPSFPLGYAMTPGGGDYMYYDGHNGWDYSMYYENVLAAADGIVQLAGSDSINPCFGQTVTIQHPQGYTTRYAHLSSIYVSPGQAVARGQVIAQSGNTGCSSGPHLHFGVYITSSWTAIDPWGWSGTSGPDPWPADPGNLWLTGTAQFPLPFVPTNVAAAGGNASASVTWSPPAFDGGTPIASYAVTASPGGATVTVGGTSTSAVVSGLINGTAYTFTVTAQNSLGANRSGPSNAVTPSGWIGAYRAVTPTRLVDTRTGLGGFSKLGPNQAIDVQVVGQGGLPSSGVAGVILNITVTNPTNASYLSVYPTGTPRPITSSLNFVAGQTVAALSEIGVGSGGRVTVYNFGGSADVLLDLSGWDADAAGLTGTAGAFRPVIPMRVLDTRYGIGGVAAPLNPNQAVDLQVTGVGGVPATGVSAVELNITATGPTAAGWLAAYPSGTNRPSTSNLNFVANDTIANRAVVQVGTNGKISLYNVSGRTQAIADVSGWFADGSDATLTQGLYIGLTPARILDTRLNGGHIGAAQILVSIAGQAGVPAMSDPVAPRAVILNVTVTNPTSASYLTVFPSGASLPTTSDVNFVQGATVPNLVITGVGLDGKVAVYNFGGSTDVIIDVLGWYN